MSRNHIFDNGYSSSGNENPLNWREIDYPNLLNYESITGAIIGGFREFLQLEIDYYNHGELMTRQKVFE